MATVLTFGNQKGGVGKTTLTNQLAMYIHNKTDYSVLAIDGDFLQESLSNTRNDELKNWLRQQEKEFTEASRNWNDAIAKALTDKYLEMCYKLVTKNMTNIEQTVLDMWDSYDLILIDMPGTLVGEGIIKIYSLIDYLFVPLDISFKDIDSTRRFIDMYNSRVRPIRENRKINCNVYGVFNKVKEGTTELKNRYDTMKEKGIDIPFLKNYITDTSQLKREDSTVAMLTLEKIKNPEMIDNFCKEIVEILLNPKN